MIDPAVQLVLRVSLALLLAAAALHKLRDLALFREALDGYDVLPRRMTGHFAAAIPGIEAAIAVALATGFEIRPAGAAAAALLAIYAGAIGVNLVRGRAGIDCGCMGPASALPISPMLVVRNLLVSSCALLLLLPVGTRALELLDLVVATSAIATLAACWAAAGRLLALAPVVQAVRRRSS